VARAAGAVPRGVGGVGGISCSPVVWGPAGRRERGSAEGIAQLAADRRQGVVTPRQGYRRARQRRAQHAVPAHSDQDPDLVGSALDEQVSAPLAAWGRGTGRKTMESDLPEWVGRPSPARSWGTMSVSSGLAWRFTFLGAAFTPGGERGANRQSWASSGIQEPVGLAQPVTRFPIYPAALTAETEHRTRTTTRPTAAPLIHRVGQQQGIQCTADPALE
jgi:hypothetical protein